MRFYRPLAPVAALTFDLDDTLYDNQPVIARTESETLDFIRRFDSRLRKLQIDHFRQMRQRLREEDPHIYHDVSEWRRRATERLMRQAGLSAGHAGEGAQAAMQHFARWRSRITLSAATHQCLAQLAKKWPLAVITNGNADPHQFGIGQHFRFILRAGPDGRAKPFADLYQRACEKLALPPQNILHIGDDLTTDIQGALQHGLQTCWINLTPHSLRHSPAARLLPHLEINQLEALTGLQ